MSPSIVGAELGSRNAVSDTVEGDADCCSSKHHTVIAGQGDHDFGLPSIQRHGPLHEDQTDRIQQDHSQNVERFRHRPAVIKLEAEEQDDQSETNHRQVTAREVGGARNEFGRLRPARFTDKVDVESDVVEEFHGDSSQAETHDDEKYKEGFARFGRKHVEDDFGCRTHGGGWVGSVQCLAFQREHRRSGCHIDSRVPVERVWHGPVGSTIDRKW